MKARRPCLIGIAMLLVVVPSAVLAAESLFLKLEGIQGESTVVGHEREIVLLSYSQSFTRPGSGAGGASAGTASCGAITVTKLVDTSSPALIGGVLSGQAIPSGVITFRKEGAVPLEYYRVLLTDVLIQAIAQSDVSPADPTTVLEQLSMTARIVKFAYTPQRPDGSAGPMVTFAWDCASNSQAPF